MRKIFSILVVLMMVAGTFVSCNIPTNTGTNTSSTDATTANVILAKEADKGGPICVIEFNGKKFWCTVSAYNIIKEKECTINTSKCYEPTCDGILSIDGSGAFNGNEVKHCIVYTEDEKLSISANDLYVIFNDDNTEKKIYYYSNDTYIEYKY